MSWVTKGFTHSKSVSSVAYLISVLTKINGYFRYLTLLTMCFYSKRPFGLWVGRYRSRRLYVGYLQKDKSFCNSSAKCYCKEHLINCTASALVGSAVAVNLRGRSEMRGSSADFIIQSCARKRFKFFCGPLHVPLGSTAKALQNSKCSFCAIPSTICTCSEKWICLWKINPPLSNYQGTLTSLRFIKTTQNIKVIVVTWNYKNTIKKNVCII